MRRDRDVCEVKAVHEEKVARVKNTMEEEEIMRLAELFKAMGDSTRLKILHALALEELCVCDLAHLLGISQSALSHQLRLLRNLRLVKHRKAGKMVFYSLDDHHIMNLFTQGLAHIRHK